MDCTKKWKTRLIHLSGWGVIIAVAIGWQIYSVKGSMELGDIVKKSLSTAFWLMWWLPPLTVVLSRATVVSDFFYGGVKRNASTGSSYNNDKKYYNLNNAADSLEFGIRTVVDMVKFLGAFFILCWVVLKYLICYLIVAVPFPIENFYYYVKSRKKKTFINVGIPVGCITIIVLCLCIRAVMQLCDFTEELKKSIVEDAIAEKNAYEELLNREYDFSFSENIEMQEGDVKFVVRIDSCPLYLTPNKKYEITRVNQGTLLVGNGVLEQPNGKYNPGYYQIYLSEDKSIFAWVNNWYVEVLE